jgi:hypothetical protein
MSDKQAASTLLDDLESTIVKNVEQIVARMTPEMRQRYRKALGPSPQTNLRSDDASREVLKQAADKMLQKTGWRPGDKFSFHSVSELMTALAFVHVSSLAEENDRLRKMLASCDWYWPEDDTSSDACADGPWQIAKNIDARPGEVFGYSRGGVVETRYYGFLEAAEDAGSDDQFEADEPTREAAEAKIATELQRRDALATTEGQP